MSTYLYHEIKTEICEDKFIFCIVFDIFEYQRACFVLKWTASNSYLGSPQNKISYVKYWSVVVWRRKRDLYNNTIKNE